MKGHTMPFYFYSACGVRDPKVLLEQGLWQEKAVCFIKPTDVTEKKIIDPLRHSLCSGLKQKKQNWKN